MIPLFIILIVAAIAEVGHEVTGDYWPQPEEQVDDRTKR